MAGGKHSGGGLDAILHGMITGNRERSVAQLAEELGKPEYIAYQWADPHQKRQFPLSMVIPLTRVTGDTRLIEHLAASVGLVVTRIRKRGKGGLEHVEDLQVCLENFAELLKSLAVIFRDKGQVDRRAVLAEIDRFMSSLAGVRQDVENMSDQYELELED